MPMSDRGDAYIARWPQHVADRAGISVEYIASAMATLGLINIERVSDLRVRLLHEAVQPLADPPGKPAPLPEVGALDSPQAKAIIAEMQAIADRIRAREYTHCRTCGRPLGRNGECRECV